ncbi:MAG TPA: DUF58 domain-containing protein [Anaerolineae bacterium]|nr:DUF58 domain-containing protein [Anaerolineae bacterium]
MIASPHVVLALLGLSLLALAVTGLPIYARLSYLWGFLLVGSWLWAALALRKVEVRRTARTLRAQVGHIFQERFEVQNSGALPRMWLEVRDQSALPGSQGSRVLTMLRGQQERSYLARVRLVQRGVFPLGPTVLASGDLFGLFPVNRTVPPDGSLLVYPMMVQVRTFPSPPGLLPGGEALRRRTLQVTPNAAGVREYVPGDSLNRIHWLSTARREQLMVKEFELDPLAKVWIFLDAAREAQSALPYSLSALALDVLWHPSTDVTLPPSTEEYAVSVAASLAQYFMQRGREVGLVSCGRSQSPSVLSPDRGGRQLGKILEALALLRSEGDLPISALATAQAQHLPRGSTVIVITPSVQEEVALAVDVLLRRGLRPVVVLLDAASFGGLPGTADLAAAITALNVPVCQVTNGVDLAMALGMAGA